MDKDRVFIIMTEKVAVDISLPLYVNDIGLVYSNNPGLQKNIEKLRIYSGSDIEDWDYIDANKIRKKFLKNIRIFI